MTIINSVSNTRFSFNGIEYFRNYISVVRGDRVEIFNCYEREDIMLSLMHYSEITLNGITYNNATDLQSALQSVIYSRATLGADEVEVVEQNNIGKVIQLNYVTGNNLLNQVLTNINSITTVVSATDNPVFFTAYKSASTSVVAQKLRFQFMGGKGTWGAGGKTVLPSHLYQLAPEALLPDDITAHSKSNVVSLGQISSSNDFINKANSTTRNFSDTSKLHFLSYTLDSVLYLKRFTGQPGEYDDTTTVLTEDDFEDATNSNVQPGLFTPSLKDITNIDPSTDIPITIVDNNSGNKTTFTGNQIKHASLDGNTTTIDYEQNTNDVSYTIPAKNTDDVFAMQSDINGMTITANQSASELYLKNAEGTVLATINVGFLNNEGTTFFFNETTEKLELKNDQGSVLSSVPVSAFVSNLIQSVNFNGSTPYVLEFKDAENNIVDSVSFSILNIQGLQAALDGKMSTSHPANALTPENISNWNTTYGWGNHSGLYLPLGADIPDAADLNTYIQTGIYIQRFNFQAAAGTNYPVPLKGFLEVLKSPDGLISQKYHVGGGDSNNYYIRVFGNTWTGWKKVLDSVDITDSDIANWNTAYGSLGSLVDKTTDQTAIAGKKSWNGLQEYNTLSSRIFVNLQSGTGLRTFYDVTSYSSSSASVTGGIQIILPLVSNSATMWVAELTVIEYSTLALGNELSPAKFIITGYGDYLTNLSVWCSHPNRFSKVKFGRNTADDKTILIIEKYDNTFVRPKVTLDKVVYSYLDSNSVLLQNPSNYGINITTDVSSFVLSDTILNENFVRDNYYQSWVFSNFVSNSYLRPGTLQVYGASFESLNSLPTGTYTAVLSTNTTDKPFNSLGGLISIGAINGQGTQILGSRSGNELWFRPFSNTYGSWYRLWNSGDFSAADVANWNNAYSWGNHAGLYVKMLGNTLSNGTGDVVTINSLGNIKYRTAVEVRQDAGIADADITDWHTAYNHSQATGNPHNTQITDISGLQSALSGKANAINTLSYKGVIPNSSDLNNYTQTGFYITLDAESNSNTPSDNNGLLHVSFDSGITACQTYHDSNNDLYVRTINEAGNWLPWDRTTKASERIINEDLAASPTQVILNSLYPNARATFTVIAPNVEKGYMYVKTNDGWLEFIGSPVY